MLTQPKSDLLDIFDALLAEAGRDPQTVAELVEMLGRIYRLTFAVDFAKFDLPSLRRGAAEMARAMFCLRVGLRDRIPEWHVRGLMTRDAQNALRDVFRALRYATDMLSELAIGFEKNKESDPPRRAFDGPALFTNFHPALGAAPRLEFRSGDVLLVRGLYHNSAAIARIGDVDSQFSHLAIVFVDDDKKPWIVESLIEVGAIITPLDESLSHGVGRAILFRHQDEELAARAAQYIHRRVKRSRSGRAPRILYDFSMRLGRYRRLFCSQLVRQAYEAASGGELKLPTFTTRFVTSNQDFLHRIGVKAKETFAPGDIELQPDFDLVAEWGDYRATPRLRAQDLIMTKLFEWMEEHRWRFKEDFLVRVIAWFGRLSAFFSDRIKDMISGVVPKVPVNMRRRTVATVVMLHQTAQPLFEEIERLEKDSLEHLGRPLHPRDVYAHMDKVRKISEGQVGYLRAP